MKPAVKPAPTDLPILKPIKNRWSPLAFSGQKIEEEKLRMLFEAARWAPSSFNEQPWRYVYAVKDGSPAREEMESLLSPGNAWAKEAHLLIVSFTKKTFTLNGKPNPHAIHDLGCATGYMVLEAVDLGLIGHQMSGFNAPIANALLKMPEDFQPGSMIAIGYPGESDALPPELKENEKKPRIRNEQSAFVFRK